MSGFSDHVVYKPKYGDALVKSGRTTIYYSYANEAFYAAKDTYLIDTTWVYKMYWENNTNATQQYSLKYTTGLKVTQGSEVTVSVGIAASYEGLSMSMDASSKVFSSYETTQSVEKTITLNIPPKSSLTFYQRKYRFRDTMFFILDAWGEEWNAGSWGGYTITRKPCEVEIMSEDYLTVDTALDASTTGTMTMPTVGRADLESRRATRKRENLTEWAKGDLSRMGL
ncbi:uncharacterized protein EV420DRAFT_301871 [Desarmillaria tabescens]|uniref:Uncharacterized protein n=1 Tax=Armillaria tabescens TaxID=1929756 RepID=A0AA39KFM5_ARMTA|nr:uncharacterized protein EV420DRAFT_301871 [Desarmillaria tabescens]KAK0459075.1 hypothetical protein EV420DRAFT_301871 [Desarmillaria tabescens]